MSFTLKKKCVVFCALAVLTLLAYKTYSEKNELHGNLYKLHKSLCIFMLCQIYGRLGTRKNLQKATWGQLKNTASLYEVFVKGI